MVSYNSYFSSFVSLGASLDIIFCCSLWMFGVVAVFLEESVGLIIKKVVIDIKLAQQEKNTQMYQRTPMN